MAGLRVSSWCFVTVVLLLALWPPSVEAGNCTMLAPQNMTRGGTHITITGFEVELRAQDTSGNLLQNVGISYLLDAFIERARVGNYVNGTDIGWYVCNEPVNPLAYGVVSDQGAQCLLTGECYVDAFADSGPSVACENIQDQPCGSILHMVMSKDLDCWQEHIYNESFLGHSRESVLVHFSDPFSSFAGTAAYHILDASVQYHPINGTSSLNYAYRKDALKLEYDLHDWPWAGSSQYNPIGSMQNNASFLSVWFNTSFLFPLGGTLTLDTGLGDGQEKLLEYNHDDYMGGNLSLSMTTQSGYIVDGLSILERANQNNLTTPWFVTVFGFNWALSICQHTFGHWTHFEYDPSLDIIFNGAPSTPGNQNPSNRPMAVGVGVSVGGVFAVTAAIATAYYLWNKNRLVASRSLVKKAAAQEAMP